VDIIIIAAVAENRVIGKGNALPWSLKEDMARFRDLTLGWPCIMGRKTWESLPQRPLPGRPTIVISRSLPVVPDAAVFPSLAEAIRHCAGHEKVFICGGASVYQEALAFAHKIELTKIHRQHEGDVFFPSIDPDRWVITGSADFDGFSFVSYTRQNKEMV
jgi:dihydrofolate reductase